MEEAKKNFVLSPKSLWRRRKRFALLAEWYGPDRAAVEIAAHTRQPAAIGGAVDEILNAAVNHGAGVLVKLRSRWTEVVGATLAAYSSPGRFQDGEFTLEVRHSALIPELNCSVDLIKDAVNRIIAPDQCRKICFVVSGSRFKR